MMLPGRRLLLLAAAALLAGCGSGEESSGSDRPDPDAGPAAQVSAEYEAAQEQYGLEFPDDVELPVLADRIESLVEAESGEVSFEEGYGESELLVVWRCAWERSLLDALTSDDAPAADRAFAMLDRTYDLELAKKYLDDPGRAWDEIVLGPARAGDTGPLAEDLVNSCGPPFADVP